LEKAKYDVFLSHATPDKPVVEELARILRMQGIEPWLDIWNLIPGEPWQKVVEDALESCVTCAVCLGPSGTGPWQNEEMRTAIERRVSGKERFRVIPVLLPHSMRGEPSRLPPFLRNAGWVEFRETLDDEKVLHRLISGIRGVQPGPGPGEAVAEGAQPYRGLQVFDVDDAPFFFGREALTEWLLDKLRPVPNASRFLAIFGPSGSGKSSLARAGLLAAVKRGEIAGSDSWPTTVFRPGEKPLETLAVQLAALGGFPSVFELLRDLAADKRALHLNARVALSQAPADRRLLVLVDQFEEVFTLCSDEAQRTAFIDNLLHAAMAADGPTVVVLTLRADFYGRCAVYPDLAPAVSDRQTLVRPMTRDELRSAIERPAYLAGCELEGGLTELLLKEVEAQPGCLPLLEYALLQIWQHREGRRLTATAYNEIHGVTGALETRAEEVYAKLTTAEGEACRQVLLKLVQVDDQGRATKRRLGLAELASEAEPEGKAMASVVARLTEARLLIAEAEGDEKRPTVEVAHEALLTGWKRLKDWIEQDRESLQTRRRLDEAVAEWTGKDRDPSYLYTGARLARAEEWAGSHLGELRPEAQEFLAASRTQEDQKAQRELVQARALEEEQRRRADAEQQRAQEQFSARKRLKRWTIASAATALAAVIAFGVALYQYKDLADRRSIAIATQLGEKVQAVKERALALLLSIEAVRRAEKAGQPHLPVAEETLRLALMGFSGAPLPTGRVRAVSLSSDHQWLAVAGTDDAISLWHLTDGGPVKAASVAELRSSSHLKQIAVSSGGRKVVVTFEASPSLLFDTSSGTDHEPSRQPLSQEDWLVQSNPFSPDGRWLLTRQAARWIIRDLSLSSAPKVATLDINPEAMAFSPDGRSLAVVDKGSLGVGDMSTLRTGSVFRKISWKEDSPVAKLSFSSDSQWLVATSSVQDWIVETLPTDSGPTQRIKTSPTSSVQAWRLRTGQDPDLQVHLEDCVWSHPDGMNLFDDPLLSGNVTLAGCQMSNIAPRQFFLSLSSIVTTTDDPTERRRVFGDVDGGIWFFDLKTPEISMTTTTYFQAGPVRVLALRGRWLITQGGNDPPRVLDVGRGTTLVELEPKVSPPVSHVEALSLDGWRLSLDSPVRRLWGPRGAQPIPGSEKTTSLWTFSPDGRWLAAATSDGGSLVWRLRENGTVLFQISFPAKSQHSHPLTVLAFSPDDRWLATGNEAGESRLWDLQHPQNEPRDLTNHSKPVTALAFSYDGHLIATAGGEGAVYLRELNGNPATHDTQEAPAPSGQSVSALAFLPDGRLAISELTIRQLGHRLRLWRRGHGEAELDVQRADTSLLTSNPQGDRLASPGAIWSLDPQDLQSKPVRLTAGRAVGVAFTRDGHGLWTLIGGSLRRWELRTDKLLATACQAVGRNLTEKEWRAYIPSEPYQEREPCPEFPKAFD